MLSENAPTIELGANVVDNNLEFSFTLNKPKLWWTWNLGEQNLYTFKVTIIQVYTDGSTNVRCMDERVTRFGIRTINWIQDLDPNGLGSSFYL